MTIRGQTLITVLPLADLYEVYADHHRLTVFVHKGRECVVCGREGVLLLTTKGKAGDVHVDLYTEDFVLMTVDHIIPKKMKGQGISGKLIESLENKQPMCDPCNNYKSDKVLSLEELQERKLKHGLPQKLTGVGGIWELVHNSNIFNREIPNNVHNSYSNA